MPSPAISIRSDTKTGSRWAPASELQSASYEPGDVIVMEGESGERFYIIAAGRARASKDGK